MSLVKKLWKAKAKPLEIQANGEVYSVTFSPDGRHVIACGQSKTVGHWRVEDGRTVGEPMDVSGYLVNGTVSKDGRLIAIGGSSGLAEVWDMRTRRRVVQANIGPMKVFGVDVSPDSSKLATGSNCDVVVWCIPTGQRILGPLRHADFVAAVKFSPNGDRIATATWEHNSIRLYDSSTGELLADIPDRISSPYNTSLVWSSDGRQLFIASHAGKIKCFHVSGSFLSWTEWDVRAHNQPVSIALASNGKFIASASSRFISFWDTSTHACIGSVIEQSERVWSIALSNDGHLASGGDDKKVIIRNLKNSLPRSYFLDPSSDASGSQTSFQSSDNTPVEVRRLEALLGERDKTIQQFRKEKGDLEQKLESLSAVLCIREEDLDQLKQEIATLRAQLSAAQGTSQKLKMRLDEAADQQKSETERIMTAFDELKIKHEVELAQAHKSVDTSPEKVVTEPHNRGIGVKVFESWMRDHSTTVKSTFPTKTDDCINSDYNALARCAFAEARLRDWDAAYNDAQKSVDIQPSAIGHIAKTLALVGKRDYRAAMRTFALVFRDGDPNENVFMLVIWAVLSCLAGEYMDGVLRVNELVNTTWAEKTSRDCVQAYMHILLGNKYLEEGNHQLAIRLFNRAWESSSSLGSSPYDKSPRLGIISLISGWSFDGLDVKAQNHLHEALRAASRTEDVAELPVGMNR